MKRIIETQRLILRQWKEEDKIPFADLNADLEVMEFFPSTVTKDKSDILVDKFIEHINEQGWGVFAVEMKTTNEFIGFIGLAVPAFNADFVPCTEILWRLRKKHWRKGYATEGAKAVLQFAFQQLGKDEIVSFTPVLNLPSIGVMEKIGMKCDNSGEFDHPKLDKEHKLCRHVLYRKEK